MEVHQADLCIRRELPLRRQRQNPAWEVQQIMHIYLGRFERFLHLQVQQQWAGLISGMGQTFGSETYFRPGNQSYAEKDTICEP